MLSLQLTLTLSLSLSLSLFMSLTLSLSQALAPAPATPPSALQEFARFYRSTLRPLVEAEEAAVFFTTDPEEPIVHAALFFTTDPPAGDIPPIGGQQGARAVLRPVKSAG